MTGYRYDPDSEALDLADRERGDEWLAEQAADRQLEHGPSPSSLADFHRRQGDQLEVLKAMADELQRTIDELRRDAA